MGLNYTLCDLQIGVLSPGAFCIRIYVCKVPRDPRFIPNAELICFLFFMTMMIISFHQPSIALDVSLFSTTVGFALK